MIGVEYRCADLPLAPGTAMMIAGTLFAQWLHVGVTPIPEGPFHGRARAQVTGAE